MQHSACTRSAGGIRRQPRRALPGHAGHPPGTPSGAGLPVPRPRRSVHAGAVGPRLRGRGPLYQALQPRANLLLDTTHTYEVCLWRTVLDTMPADPALTATQARQLAALREKFAAFPALGTELVPQNSMLREFIGK